MILHTMSTEKKAKRTSHPKVRSGCQTCKIRRKKCDETHPSCLRCTNAGQTCEYVETPDRRKRGMRAVQALVPNSAPRLLPRCLIDPSQVGLSLAERRFLDFFKMHTSRKCTGSTVDDFWQRLIYQVAEEEPAVRHAAIAMSSMHWQFIQEVNFSNSKPYIEESSAFTLAQCTKALVSLRQRLAKGDAYATTSAHREAVLVSCIAFVSLSLFQGDVKAVTSHLRSGYSVLMEWQRVNFDGNPSGVILMRAFADLQLHRITFSQPQHEMEAEADELPIWQAITVCRPVYGYSGVSESDFSIVLGASITANYPQGFERRVGPSIQGMNDALADLLYQNSAEKTLAERLLNWKSEFHAFISTHRDTLSPQDRGPLLVIEMWTTISDVLLSALMRPLDEMSYDSSLPLFQRINALASLYLSLEEQVSLFSTKTLLLQVLHFTATKCRDWHTRRESLSLVRQSRRREGLWTSNHFVALLSHVFEQESAGLTPNDVIPRAARIDLLHLKPLDQKKFNSWYHRPCTPEEIANGADVHGKWTKVELSA